MSLDALLRHLEDEAERNAARLRDEAESRAADILARAEADAARARTLHLDQVAAERRTEFERRVAATRAEARAGLLAVRARVLDRIFGQAAASLERLPAREYEGVMGRLVTDAARYLEGEPAILRAPADAAAAIQRTVGRESGLTVESAAMPAGVTACTSDGRVLVDNTMPAILARLRPDLAIGLVSRIEGP
jgi:vacuolar-type H+-ATPase subunit E/Vma4